MRTCAVASYQRGIIVCILIYCILVAVQFGIPPEFRALLAFVLLPLGLAGTVFVFLLSTKVYGTGVGVLLGILTLIPCIGLIVLLTINGKATAILRQNDIRVGLMGRRYVTALRFIGRAFLRKATCPVLMPHAGATATGRAFLRKAPGLLIPMRSIDEAPSTSLARRSFAEKRPTFAFLRKATCPVLMPHAANGDR